MEMRGRSRIKRNKTSRQTNTAVGILFEITMLQQQQWHLMGRRLLFFLASINLCSLALMVILTPNPRQAGKLSLPNGYSDSARASKQINKPKLYAKEGAPTLICSEA